MNPGLVLERPKSQPELDRPISQLMDVELIEGVSKVRASFRVLGEDLLKANKSMPAEQVPLPIDVLAPARRVLDIEKQFSQNSPEYIQARHAINLHSERLIGEVESANEAEFFEEKLYDFDPISEGYYLNGESINQIVVNGLSPLTGETEEEEIRIGEFVDEGTHVLIGKHKLADSDHPLVSLKECPEYALRAYEAGDDSKYFGNVPRVDKFMIHNDLFIENGRLHSQFALPGKYITRDIRRQVLRDMRAIAQNENPSPMELRGRQYIGSTRDAALDLIRALDDKASEVWGINIFMGMPVEEDHPRDYQAFMVEAKTRAALRQEKAASVTEIILEMARQDLDSAVADLQLNRFLTQHYISEAIEDPAVAQKIFDEATAAMITEIHNLRAKGNYQEAADMEQFLRTTTRGVSYCGAGSCGLQSANQVESSKARELGLKGEIIKDDVRKCSCGGNVYYDVKGNKACIDCNKRQLDGRTSYGKEEKPTQPKDKDKSVRWLF